MLEKNPCHDCCYEYESQETCSSCGCKDMEYEIANLDGKLFVSESNNKAWVLDGVLFQVIESKNDCGMGFKWAEVKTLTLGEQHRFIADKYYFVTKNHEPYLTVKLFYDYEPYRPTYTLWHCFLVIKRFHDFYFIDVLTCETGKFPHEGEEIYGFIDEFYQIANRLLVASIARLYCFDESLGLIWESDCITSDCLSVHSYEDGCIIVTGDDDPPFGWIKGKVELTTGKLVEKENDCSEHYWRTFFSNFIWNHKDICENIANCHEKHIDMLNTIPTDLLRGLYPAILEGTLKSKHRRAISLCEKICREQNIEIDVRLYT